MDRAIFQNVLDPAERLQNLKDTADGVEEVEYMKPFEADEMIEKKERLANVSIAINDINVEKKAVVKDFDDKLKEPKADQTLLLKELKEKANQVKERCFLFFNENDKMAMYYNAVGILVTARPMTPKEMAAASQSSIPGTIREMRSGTND